MSFPNDDYASHPGPAGEAMKKTYTHVGPEGEVELSYTDPVPFLRIQEGPTTITIGYKLCFKIGMWFTAGMLTTLGILAIIVDVVLWIRRLWGC